MNISVITQLGATTVAVDLDTLLTPMASTAKVSLSNCLRAEFQMPCYDRYQ